MKSRPVVNGNSMYKVSVVVPVNNTVVCVGLKSSKGFLCIFCSVSFPLARVAVEGRIDLKTLASKLVAVPLPGLNAHIRR